MKMSKPYAWMAVVTAGMLLISGCGATSMWNDSGVDSRRDDQGHVILLDTPRMWDKFVLMTNIAIDDEVAGKTHWGKSKDANSAWVKEIRNMSTYREHPQKYIDYIIKQRRKAGLPELVGYP